MPHLLEHTFSQIRDFKKPDYLLTQFDRQAGLLALLQLAVAEIDEVRQARGQDNELETAFEFADVLVFLLSAILTHLPDHDITFGLTTVNSLGKHENRALERLELVVLDAADDPRAMTEALRIIWSLSIWQPYARAGLEAMAEVLKKVAHNYPPELLTTFDPTLGRNSLADEVRPRYKAMVGRLRVLREVHHCTLTTAHWLPFKAEIQNWQNPPEPAVFKAKVEAAHAKQVVVPQPGTAYTSRVKE